MPAGEGKTLSCPLNTSIPWFPFNKTVMQLIEYNNLQIVIRLMTVSQKLQMNYGLSFLVQPHRQKLI